MANGLIEYLSRAPANISKAVGPAMKEVFGERVNPRGLPAPEAATQAAKTAARVGPLSGILAAAGGVEELYGSGLNPMNTSSRMDISRQMLDAQGFNPSEAQRAAAGTDMKAIADRAVGRAKGELKAAPARYKEGLAQGKYPIDLTVPNPKAPSAPTEVETQRQVLEQGAKEQLRTNQLSRPQAAEAVVEADIARTGETLTPDQKKARVAQESQAMRGMSNDDLSRYISYAMVGAGLLASALDSSGAAGQAFAGSFNTQLDRELQGGLKDQEQAAKALQNAQKNALEDRKITATERDVESKVKDRASKAEIYSARTEGLLDRWENEARLGNAKLAETTRNNQARDASYRERTAKSGTSSKKQLGAPLTFPQNKELVESYMKSQDVKADKGVVENIASQLGNLQKNMPGYTPEEYLQQALRDVQIDKGEEYSTLFGFNIPFTGKDSKVSLKAGILSQ